MLFSLLFCFCFVVVVSKFVCFCFVFVVIESIQRQCVILPPVLFLIVMCDMLFGSA